MVLSSKAISDRAAILQSELEVTKDSVRKANATISEFEVNERKGYSCIIHLALIANMIFLLVNHRIT